MTKYILVYFQIYANLRDKVTPNGVTLDMCIQTGVDNPGHPYIKTVGCVAGDEESYEVHHPFGDIKTSEQHSFKLDLNLTLPMLRLLLYKAQGRKDFQKTILVFIGQLWLSTI